MTALKDPHGGVLKNLYLDDVGVKQEKALARDLPSWDLNMRQVCDIEMLLIRSDVETLHHGSANRAQLIHDDRVPLLPARRQPGPRRSLTVSDLIAARHQ